MEENLNSINAMKTMEVIDINTGTKLGFISDIKIDCEEQKILSILLPGESKGWFSKIDDIEVMWKDIVKIGIDVILVNAKGTSADNISE
ncbi:YlmC/YmxH family sporulation protein [uncultured Clostridium sp.]|uniref:YlmC/YmxH family sporulation protein n=1 Tax=uncultured Clostridium sp. TaxID=59620 RepID=UPI0025E3452E|nr:YlmC/YmxH family sporulation protein [uncultured Clostridium sp.]